MISLLTVLSVAVGVPTAVACGSMVFAARSARRTRQGRLRTSHLTAGAVLSAGGLAVLALTAWSTHEDQHYDDRMARSRAPTALDGCPRPSRLAELPPCTFTYRAAQPDLHRGTEHERQRTGKIHAEERRGTGARPPAPL
ncbi:hypothetical protein GBF35_06405 [Nonomuraea phyllanthi]|uniref:hypothetical protein n=1 Tax=Nonomuraea phyllanthi TaxID=2219224 RepID=UPI001293A84E|nr:hypothetical protein [Nonomuraea phyllanthi]QFY06360.1 hypothetical protein GBF35_06405 [Nonomuraea phyllanthi]